MAVRMQTCRDAGTIWATRPLPRYESTVEMIMQPPTTVAAPASVIIASAGYADMAPVSPADHVHRQREDGSARRTVLPLDIPGLSEYQSLHELGEMYFVQPEPWGKGAYAALRTISGAALLTQSDACEQEGGDAMAGHESGS